MPQLTLTNLVISTIQDLFFVRLPDYTSKNVSSTFKKEIADAAIFISFAYRGVTSNLYPNPL